MPRLDNSLASNLETLREWGEFQWSHIEFDPSDPGKMPPMDVCRHCHRELFANDDGLVEHPSYADDAYFCTACQRRLDEDDDYPDKVAP